MKLPILAASLVVSLFQAQIAQADDWGFPLRLTDENTEITFEVDSTWHTIHGRTSGISGSVSLRELNNPPSVTGEIRVPVAAFDTDSSKRDSRLKEVMDAQTYPHVIFTISGADTSCSPGSLAEGQTCMLTLHGNLNIRNENRPWNISASLQSRSGNFRLEGKGVLRWADFGVTDPSILIAKLKPDVSVSIKSKWKK